MEFKNKNYIPIFPSPDTIYNNQIVIDNDPKRIKSNNNNNNSYNYGIKRKNIYINKSKSKDKYRKSSKSIGNKINNNNNNNNNINNIQTQNNQKLTKIPIPKKSLISNNNIINNNILNNNNSNEKNINCLKTIKPSDSDLNCTFTTTNTTFISKSNENILNTSNDKIKLLFSRKEKSRFDFVENSNINNKKKDEIIIPDFIRKITDKACNMIPLTKYYKNNNFIDDIFLYKEELNECNCNNENWKKYFIKSYNDKKDMYLKNPSNKDILLKDFEKINNFVLKNNNKSA